MPPAKVSAAWRSTTAKQEPGRRLNAATQLSPALTDANITFSAASCAVGAQMTVTISYPLSTMTGIAGPFGMTGKGTMLCGG